MSSPKIDPITLEMLWRRLGSIVGELGATLRRTSFSTVVRDIGDYGCAIFDREARLLAQTPDSTPGLCGPLGSMLRHMLTEIPPDRLEDGDILICNDPWKGSGHHNDITLATPVFLGGRIVAYITCCAHQVDIGGRRATTESRDNYEEGLRIPVLKFYRRGEINTDVQAFIRWNVRSADTVVGDISAQVAANHVGRQRVLDICRELGWTDIQALADEIIERSEALTRAEIAKLPRGSYSYTAVVDIVDKQEVTIKTVVTLTGDRIIVDFSGSSPQVAPAVNCTLTYSSAYTVFALNAMLNLPIAMNEGTLRPLEIKADPGTIVNATFPAPVFARTSIGNFLPDCVFQALAPAAPERIAGGAGATPMWGQYMFGRRKDGTEFAPFNVASGGLGARYDRDGVSCLAFPYNVGNTPVEVMESEVPLICRERSLWVDSAGPGRQRGGFGQKYVLEFLTDELGPEGPVLVSFRGGRFIHPVPGLLGGGTAPNGYLNVAGEDSDCGRQMTVRAGDAIISHIPGGGGLGDPRERDPKLIAADLKNGLITPEYARKHHGYDADARRQSGD